VSWLAKLLSALAPPKQVADADCEHCRGVGYDASGLCCTCVKELK